MCVAGIRMKNMEIQEVIYVSIGFWNKIFHGENSTRMQVFWVDAGWNARM